MELIKRILGIAPELKGAVAWINSKPLTMKELRGKVVMIDFWTYSCVNCVRTFPHMKEIWAKYKDKGFVLIGVHTPEFDFEKNIDNIRSAAKRHGLAYPIAVDSDHAVWNAYFNHYWPAQYLIDADGNIRYRHFGEGGEAEIESWIVKLLEEAGKKVKMGKITETAPQIYGNMTEETYCGSARSRGIGSGKVCTREGCDMYIDPGKNSHEEGIIYLQGQWNQLPEFLQYNDLKEGYLLLPYQAREVNLVIGNSGKKFDVEVQLDDKPLSKSNAGSDVKFKNGKSFITVDRYDMYRLVKTKNIEAHEVKLIVKNKEFQAYAYTFG